MTSTYGREFEVKYNNYVKLGKFRQVILARDLFKEITNSQRETGTPYMLYKDACNRKSNQKNLGTIKCSNLCTEIIEYSDDKEHAVCNLGSIALSKCIKHTHSDLLSQQVTLYTINNCNWCKLAINLLKKNNMNYEVVSVNNDEQKELVKGELLMTTFPIIQIGKKVYCYQELERVLKPEFDYEKLERLTRILTRNLNKIIDKNYYPTFETKMSNRKHRPIGIGVQGLADVFIQLNHPFDSSEARTLNKKIFEVIYYSSLDESCNEAFRFNNKLNELRSSHYNSFIHYDNDVCGKIISTYNESPSQEYCDLFYSINPTEQELNADNGAYSSYNNSPMFQGLFQFDLWETEEMKKNYTLHCDWESLRTKIRKFGVRNSLLVAPMPTASTSQILGNNECIEPYTSNLYTRRTLSGEFTIVNKWLMDDLIRMNLWDDDMRQKLIYYRGSIQKIVGIPQETKDLYKTAWELKQKVIADLAVDRAYFIDQSQSLNVFFEDPTHEKLLKYHIYTWKKGLKTGSYYIRSKPAVNSQQFTIDPKMKLKIQQEEENYNPCEMCSA